MSRERTQEQIAVMRAYVDGATIQRRFVHDTHCGARNWADDVDPEWSWTVFDYRVKLKPREFWVNIYPNQGGYAAHKSRQIADKEGLHDRIDCIRVREVFE